MWRKNNCTSDDTCRQNTNVQLICHFGAYFNMYCQNTLGNKHLLDLSLDSPSVIRNGNLLPNWRFLRTCWQQYFALATDFFLAIFVAIFGDFKLFRKFALVLQHKSEFLKTFFEFLILLGFFLTFYQQYDCKKILYHVQCRQCFFYKILIFFSLKVKIFLAINFF